jgi:parvulin-like peptidyl-prolyl isomerase
MRCLCIAPLAVALAFTLAVAPAGADQPPATSGAAPACPECAKDREPVATIDGAPVTRGEFKEFLLGTYGTQGALETYVNQRLIRIYAEKQGVKITKEDEERWIDQQMADISGMPELQNVDKEEVRRQYRPHAQMFALIDRLVKARRSSEEGLRREYELRYGERRRARHILFQVARGPGGKPDLLAAEAAKKRAEDTVAQIRKGGDFGEFARRLSEDPGSRNTGGELPEFGRSDMVPEFADAAFKLKEGEVSDPVLSQFGWHIIQVTKIVPAAKPFDEAVKAELAREATKRPVDREEYGRFLQDIRSRADVKILLGNALDGAATTGPGK